MERKRSWKKGETKKKEQEVKQKREKEYLLKKKRGGGNEITESKREKYIATETEVANGRSMGREGETGREDRKEKDRLREVNSRDRKK